MRRTIGTLAVLATTATITLSGCGGGSDKASDTTGSGTGAAFAASSAADITAAAKADMKALESVHLEGNFPSDNGAVTLDLSLTTTGDCTGSIGLGDGHAELVSQGGTSWFKPDEAFWKAQAGDSADMILSVVGDKWVVLPAGDESFTSFCDLSSLLDQVGSDDDEKDYTVGDPEDYDGTSAVTLSGTDKDDGGAIKVYISAEAPHYILRLEKTGGTENGDATFSDFDEPLDITVPTDTIDLSNLAG